MNRIIVIGGGPSGMAAACFAKKEDTEVLLIEQNEKLGKKLFITGKGRCNLTNRSDPEEMLKHVVSNPKFLYSALYGFTDEDLMRFVEEAGCPLKVERGNRVFPVSDHSSDVIKAWESVLRKKGVRILLETKAEKLLLDGGICNGVIVRRNGRAEEISASAVIVATGGISYPATGATGSGYLFAENTGHRVTDRIPALVPLEAKEEWVSGLAGLSLRNVGLKICGKRGVLYEDFGEMLFTHTGLSGPIVLSASSVIGKALQEEKTLSAFIDLKPALSHEELDKRILRDFGELKNKQFKNSLEKLLPKSLIPVAAASSGIPGEKPVNSVTKEERNALVSLLKALPVTITGTRGFHEAIITQGGVSVRDIDPSTMESKKVKHLYFAGEVLDIDALTGGYNLQLAFSTGVLAGRSTYGI